MPKKGYISRRFSTGDIKIDPTVNGGGNNNNVRSIRGAGGGGSRHDSPLNSAATTPRKYSSQRGASPGPPSLRKKGPSILARANSFQGMNKQNTKKVSKTSVYSFNLTKEHEKLEAELVSKRSKSIRRYPGPEARELRTQFPSKRISSDIDKMVRYHSIISEIVNWCAVECTRRLSNVIY
jgi:hypothetical protein